MADMNDMEECRANSHVRETRAPVRILIAEDEPVHLFLLEMFLKKWGYEAMGVDNGGEAWRILDGPDSPRVAILDWELPGLDGIEICRAVRRSAARPYTYILLLTARAQQADMQKGLAAGADDYLTKPYDPEELRKRLLAACQQLELTAALAPVEGSARSDAGIAAVGQS